MKLEIKVPSVGESVSSADIESWEKQSGDQVKKGDILVVLETDKASMEVPAEQDGILNIVKNKGETVTVGEVIGFIDAHSSNIQTPDPAFKQSSSHSESDKIDPVQESSDKTNFLQEKHILNQNTPSFEFQNTKDNLSPSVRRLIEVNQMNPSKIVGTGRGGRLTKEDILTSLKQDSTLNKQSTGSYSAPKQSPISNEQEKQRQEEAITRKGQRREAMTNLRRKTAQRLVQSQQSTATLSTFNEVDLSRIIEIRKNYQEIFTKKHGIKLGFMSFFVKAVVSALKEYPRINAFIEGTDIIYNDHQHIGIAVSTDKGLVVPVIFFAESLSLAEIEKKIIEYRDKALSRKLTPDDLLGGTFTISNGGVFGSLLSTPILNPPQSGILGMHKIEQRPVARNGKVEIRPMMYVTLSYDHRVVDGRESVSFLVKVKEGLEEPARLIIDI